MQSPDILLESSFPRNWHSEKKSIQPGIIKSLADIAAGRKNNPLVSQGYSGQRVGCALALLLAHATLEDKQVFHHQRKLLRKVLQVFGPCRHTHGRPPRL